MVVGEVKRTANIMDGIENTGDVRLHDHRLRLKQRFDIVRKLGQGTYGKVQLGINKKTGQEVAIKTIKKCKIETEADLIRIRREVQIMSSVRHPNIVHIYEVFENSEKMILVMEYCSGGELYDYLSQKKVLLEDEARRLFRQIATAVYYCHIHKICHRDLKLENVLLDQSGSAKIADFGLSNVFKETSLLSTFCGSPLYASPEIVKGTPYIGPEVDCWSLGVLLYTLVYGAMPFDGSNFKRLVRQISNGDYYEPKNPSTASPLIRDMLTVDPLKRADIAYICDHPWVNTGCETSCLEVSEVLAAETPVRLDLLLSLAPAAPSNSNSVMVPPETELGPEESGTDLTSTASMAVEPSNSAEKRILELVAEGGEDAIKPSPTRTIVSATDNKRKLELAMSASGLQRKKECVASSASIAPQDPVPEEASPEATPAELLTDETQAQPGLKSSATMTITPSPTPVPIELARDATKDIVKEPSPKEEETKDKLKTRVAVKKKTSPTKLEEKISPEKQEEPKVPLEESKPSAVASAADKLTSLSLSQQPPANQSPAKPKKLSIPGGNVGNFKDQFERRASLTSPPTPRLVTKPDLNLKTPRQLASSTSKIGKAKAQSEDRELPARTDVGSVRLQQIGIEPSPASMEEAPRGGVKKTESEPTHGATAVDPSVLLQDARRSLQNSMAKLVEEKAGEENRRRAARDIISTAIRTGKPPVPYGRSSSAGVASLASPPGTPPAPPSAAARVFRTEAQHRVEDHRNRGVSVERIIPIQMTAEEPPPPPPPQPAPPPQPRQPPPGARPAHAPLRRLVSSESNTSETSSPGEPIKKSAREFIIPIAVEGKGYVTPRQGSLEPETSAARKQRTPKPRRISSLVSGGESEEEDDTHMHRLRSTRAARAESVSSGEEDEEDEGFHLLTAENLFSTLLHRVRALTNRLNGEEGPGFSQHPHSLFNNLNRDPFFNSPHLPRRHLFREGWGARDLHANFDSMFSKPRHAPRGSGKRGGEASEGGGGGGGEESLDLSSLRLSERELRALSGLTPALARRLQRQLLAHLPPAAASTLRRTLSLHDPAAAHPAHPARAQPEPPRRSHSEDAPSRTDDADTENADAPEHRGLRSPSPDPRTSFTDTEEVPSSVSQFCTLPRLRRRSTLSREAISPTTEVEYTPRSDSLSRDTGRGRATPDRSLLSKYLTPERSLEEAYSSDGGSILSEPSYVAAYGGGPRRHSLRSSDTARTPDAPRRRLSRFLRSDFFDGPADETVYQKRRKEKELETQKILREIREKKNKTLEPSVRSPTSDHCEPPPAQKDDYARKCLSPVSLLAAKERSRSMTPFFPILDNIKETALDTSAAASTERRARGETPDAKQKPRFNDGSLSRESKLMRPKSYPVKNLDSVDEASPASSNDNSNKENEIKDKRESKLIRPKSYPTSSPSPEKVYINRSVAKKEETLSPPLKDVTASSESKGDIEVSFSITLPKRKTELLNRVDSLKNSERQSPEIEKIASDSLVLKKYQIINKESAENTEPRKESETVIANGSLKQSIEKCNSNSEDRNVKVVSQATKKEEVKLKSTDSDGNEKKGTIKKKIIKKVSSKSKTDLGSSQDSSEAKGLTEKKKVTKKVKDKTSEDGTKSTVTKKKSVLQSIGHKLEKLASTKSNSPDKGTENGAIVSDSNNESTKLNRRHREQSVPVTVEPPNESNLIKRAVTLTDVAALDSPTNTCNAKTTVSKVLGLFKKFEPKEKTPKLLVEKPQSENLDGSPSINSKPEIITELVSDSLEKDKPKRPTSLLLNGLGRKNKYGRTASDSVSVAVSENDDQIVLKKDSEPRNLRNTLKLDFSRLPRVKKIVPTNPVIEPQIIRIPSEEKETDKKDILEKNGTIPYRISCVDSTDTLSRSRSRSRSTISNSELKSDLSADSKSVDKHSMSPSDTITHHPLRNHESTSPEKEDIVDRIRRKSFYSRFNEKKQRRKSSLVGPGAAEYDPLARIHSAPTETKPRDLDPSPTSPSTYDLSPGFSVASDLSPSTERYRTLLTDLPVNTRNNLRFEHYGLNDKIDTYRSLDRNDFRKYPGNRSYLDYDQPSSYGTNRYSRTKSLLDSSDGTEEPSLSHLRDAQKYNRTLSMYSPGSYATYRPKRTRNSAIILKESEKEPSPENILEKIRQRKSISISVTRKPDPEKDPLPRSTVSPKGEGDRAECLAKAD